MDVFKWVNDSPWTDDREKCEFLANYFFSVLKRETLFLVVSSLQSFSLKWSRLLKLFENWIVRFLVALMRFYPISSRKTSVCSHTLWAYCSKEIFHMLLFIICASNRLSSFFIEEITVASYKNLTSGLVKHLQSLKRHKTLLKILHWIICSPIELIILLHSCFPRYRSTVFRLISCISDWKLDVIV